MMDSGSDEEDIMDVLNFERRRNTHSIIPRNYLQSDSEDEPPRRRQRLGSDILSSRPGEFAPTLLPGELRMIRDVRVRVPRVDYTRPPRVTYQSLLALTNASVNANSNSSNSSDRPVSPAENTSGSGSGNIAGPSTRINTRAASAAAAAAAAAAIPNNRPPTPFNPEDDVEDDDESDLGGYLHPLIPIRRVEFREVRGSGSGAVDNTSSNSSADPVEIESLPPNWYNHRRLQRRNAIFHDNGDGDDADDERLDPDRPLLNVFQGELEDLFAPGPNPNIINLDDSAVEDSDDSSDSTEFDFPRANNALVNNAPAPALSSQSTDGDNSKSVDDDEGLTCLICYEPFTNSGEHRITCLKCGHTYGKACIEKWIKNERRCPQCNAKATKKDVRVLYVKNLKAIDTVERDKLLVDLEGEREAKRKLELECTKLRQMNQCRDADFVKLNAELQSLRDKVGGIYRDPVSSTSEAISSTVSSRGFIQSKILDFKDGECRVGAYNQWLNMTAISQTIRSALYPQGCYGIKRINMLDFKTLQTTPTHQKEIRDLQFNKLQNDLLLSVGMDKKAILTNCQTNVIVQNFTAPQPLWSCTWNSMCQNLFYVGTNNGQIVAYDLRNPQDSVKTLTVPSEDMSPIARMHFVTPSYQNSTFNLSGILIQKLNSCWFCEIRSEKEIFHQLPVEGSFISLDFESKSRHMLISTRPTTKSPIGRHLICELNQYYSDAQQCNICSCNIVQSFEGVTVLGKMSRSSIFSPVDGTVIVGANGGQNMVNLWNISDVNSKQTLQTRDEILDFVPSEVNDSFLLNMITKNGLQIYKHV